MCKVRRRDPLAATQPIAHGAVWRRPVSEMERETPDPATVSTDREEARPPSGRSEEAPHRGVLPTKEVKVAARLVLRPRREDADVAPAGRGHHGKRIASTGHDHRDAATTGLLGGDVPQPLAQEPAHIEVVGGGGREDGVVARPPLPFVTLGAVGGDINEIRLATPSNGGLQLIEQRIGCGERAALGEVGVKHYGRQFEVVGGDAADADVPESHIGQARRVRLIAVHAGVGCGGLGRPQRLHEEFAIDEYLRVPEGQDGAVRAGNARRDDSCEVLPEVVDEFAGRALGNRDGPEELLGAHRCAVVRNEGRAALRLRG